METPRATRASKSPTLGAALNTAHTSPIPPTAAAAADTEDTAALSEDMARSTPRLRDLDTVDTAVDTAVDTTVDTVVNISTSTVLMLDTVDMVVLATDLVDMDLDLVDMVTVANTTTDTRICMIHATCPDSVCYAGMRTLIINGDVSGMWMR